MTVEELAAACRAFVDRAKSQAADGLTVSEFAELTADLLRLAVSMLEAIPTDGPSKKAMALEAVGLLFDSVADRLIPALAWPVWLIVKPGVRQLVILAAGGVLESLIPVVRAA